MSGLSGLPASTGRETYIFDFLGDELGEPLLEGLLLGGGGSETRCVGERRARCLQKSGERTKRRGGRRGRTWRAIERRRAADIVDDDEDEGKDDEERGGGGGGGKRETLALNANDPMDFGRTRDRTPSSSDWRTPQDQRRINSKIKSSWRKDLGKFLE